MIIPSRVSLRQLEAFARVAELHSFSAAAERLGLTAQAVSQLVAELESILGFRVFDRTTRRVALSAAGRDFLPSAETVLRHLDAAEAALARASQALARIDQALTDPKVFAENPAKAAQLGRDREAAEAALEAAELEWLEANEAYEAVRNDA